MTVSGFGQIQNVSLATGDWSILIKLPSFHPNDDQQSNVDSDFVGNENYAIMETHKDHVTFSDNISDEVYYFRVKMEESSPKTSIYFGIDIDADSVADLFIEANVKCQSSYVSYHLRDYSKSGLSPSQTSWLNGSQDDQSPFEGFDHSNQCQK